jgi:hypothetical protein
MLGQKSARGERKMKGYEGGRRAILVAVALTNLWVGGAVADDAVDWITGTQLFEDCQGNDKFCLGYIMGATASRAEHGSSFCLSGDVKGDQVADAVKAWLGDHPDKRGLAASHLVFQALKEKFPCN